jgi:hypothetical protein
MELLLRPANDRADNQWTELAGAIRARRLYKRAVDLPASDVPSGVQLWLGDDADLTARVEDALAAELELPRGGLLLDFPSRSSMLGVDLPLRLRTGATDRLTDEGRAGQLGLPRVADELYRSAQRFRVFVANPVARSLNGILEVATLPVAEIESRLRAGKPLLH